MEQQVKGLQVEIQLQLMVQELMVTRYLASSVIAFTAAGNPALLRKTTQTLLSQKGKAFELDIDLSSIGHQ
jgi:hypothetical protein